MSDVFTNLFFLVFAFVTITNVAWAIGYYWHKIRTTELETNLKQEMIQQGMSADDIVKVLQASKNPLRKRESIPAQEEALSVSGS